MVCLDFNRINYKSTTTLTQREEHIMGNSVEIDYLTESRNPVSFTSVQGIARDRLLPICRHDHRNKISEHSMEAGSSRCSVTNQELQIAQKMYETRTTARNKRKIAELEASVKEEETKCTEENIVGEVDWLHDPGTPSKRATQYVRTKAESWRIKTLLAKALDAKDEGKQQSAKENVLP